MRKFCQVCGRSPTSDSGQETCWKRSNLRYSWNSKEEKHDKNRIFGFFHLKTMCANTADVEISKIILIPGLLPPIVKSVKYDIWLIEGHKWVLNYYTIAGHSSVMAYLSSWPACLAYRLTHWEIPTSACSLIKVSTEKCIYILYVHIEAWKKIALRIKMQNREKKMW